MFKFCLFMSDTVCQYIFIDSLIYYFSPGAVDYTDCISADG